MIAPGFQMLAGSLSPSHAYRPCGGFRHPVTVHGMEVNSGDLIHADQHGAVVVPLDIIDTMKAALDELTAREAQIIKAAKEGRDRRGDQGGDQGLTRHSGALRRREPAIQLRCSGHLHRVPDPARAAPE